MSKKGITVTTKNIERIIKETTRDLKKSLSPRGLRGYFYTPFGMLVITKNGLRGNKKAKNWVKNSWR